MYHCPGWTRYICRWQYGGKARCGNTIRGDVMGVGGSGTGARVSAACISTSTRCDLP